MHVKILRKNKAPVSRNYIFLLEIKLDIKLSHAKVIKAVACINEVIKNINLKYLHTKGTNIQILK